MSYLGHFLGDSLAYAEMQSRQQNREVLDLSDALREQFTEFAFVARRLGSESTVLGLPDHTRSSCFFQLQRNLLNILVTLLWWATLLPASGFDCFGSVMVEVKLVKHIFSVSDHHVYLLGFQISHEIKQRIPYQHINHNDITNHSGYLQQPISKQNTEKTLNPTRIIFYQFRRSTWIVTFSAHSSRLSIGTSQQQLILDPEATSALLVCFHFWSDTSFFCRISAKLIGLQRWYNMKRKIDT